MSLTTLLARASHWAQTCILVLLVGAGAVLGASEAHAAKPGCHGKFWNPLTDIDFNNAGGIRIAGIPFMKAPKTVGDPPITKAKPVCQCEFGIGVSLTYWLPSYLSDVARSAGCIGFLKLDILPGFTATGTSGQETAFHSKGTEGVTLMQVHWAYADITAIAAKTIFEKCGEIVSELNLAYLTEVDFVYHNDVYSSIMAPYNSLLAANPMLGQMLCGMESVANTLGAWQDTGLCAWIGSRFPMSGNATSKDSAQVSNMDVQVKFMARQSLLGTMLRTTGKDAMCKPRYSPIWNSFQHRFQWVYPGKTTTRFNINALRWGFFKNGSNSGLTEVANQMSTLSGLNVVAPAGESGSPTAAQNNLAANIMEKLWKPLNYPTREAGHMYVWEARQCCIILVSLETVLKGIISNILTPGAGAAQWVHELYAAYQVGSFVYNVVNDPLGAAFGLIGGSIGGALGLTEGGGFGGLMESMDVLVGAVTP